MANADKEAYEDKVEAGYVNDMVAQNIITQAQADTLKAKIVDDDNDKDGKVDNDKDNDGENNDDGGNEVEND